MPEPPRTGDAVLELVRKSELVADDVLANFLTRSGPLPPTAPDTATRMVQDGLLTPFQAKLILQGKYRGFRIGPYKILDRLGAGGMGQVFLAEHTAMRRKVALKVLPHKMAADRVGVERFYREARAAAALDHPNIVRAHDVGHERGTHFLVMEYVEGRNLEDRLRAFGGKLPWGEAVGYVVQAAAGLQHAHEKGLVHRDIKPANLLVDKEGVVKLLDLGLARFFEDEADKLTRNLDGGAVMGTADYVAPEQLLDSSATDHRADIYSLGATLYHLITGRPPFEGTTTAKLVAHQLKTALPAHILNKEIPEELSDVIERMMAKGPDDRYQTAAEVVRDLLPFAAEGPSSSGSSMNIPATVLATVTRATGDLRASLTRSADDVELPGEESPRVARKKVLAITGLGLAVLVGCGLIAFALIHTSKTPKGEAKKSDEDTLPRLGGSPRPGGVAVARPVLTPALRLNTEKATTEAMVFTPDGKKLLTATERSVRVWDAATGNPIRRLDGHTGNVRGLSLLPGGRRVLSSSQDKTVRLWDVETGELLKTYEGASAYVANVAALPNGRRFITAATDGTIWLWDVDSGDVVKEYPQAPLPVYAIAVTRDGRRCVAGLWDAKRNGAKSAAELDRLLPTQVWVFEVESGKELRRQNVPASVSLINLSPDSKLAAFGTGDGIATWDIDSGALRTFPGLTARPTSAVFNKDGRFVMATGHDRSLSLWDVGAGLLSVEPGLPGQGNSIGLAPDGKRVAAGGAGGGAGLWNLPPVAVPASDTNEFVALRRLTGFNGHLEDAVFTADGRRVVACGADRTVRAWDAATGEQVLRFAVPANPRGLAVLSGDRLVVTFTATGEVRTYDLKDGKPLREFPHDRGVVSAAAMPDGKRFLTCGHGQAVHLWDADTGEEVGRFELGETGHGLAACPDGKRFVVACANRQNPKAATVRLWDMEKKAELRRVVVPAVAWRVGVSADGRWAGFAAGNQFHLWDLRTGLSRVLSGPKGQVDGVAFTKDGRYAVVASADKVVQVYNTDTGAVNYARGEHTASVRAVAISPDGRFAATTSTDDTAIVWELPAAIVPKK